MSTVLWANCLSNGTATSDACDKFALFKHADKLDAVCSECGLMPLSEICDATDMRFNLDDIELPDGMSSTDELMARDGVWIEAQQAVVLLEELLAAIRSKQTRFGSLRNDHGQVVAELEDSIAFAKGAAGNGAKFHFSVVT